MQILPAASTDTYVQRALTTPLSDPAQKWRSQDLNSAPVTVELGRHSSLPTPHLLSLNLKPSLHRGLISRLQSTPNLSSFSISLRSADVSPDVPLLSHAPFPKATATGLHPGPPVPPPPPASLATPSPPLARAFGHPSTEEGAPFVFLPCLYLPSSLFPSRLHTLSSPSCSETQLECHLRESFRCCLLPWNPTSLLWVAWPLFRHWGLSVLYPLFVELVSVTAASSQETLHKCLRNGAVFNDFLVVRPCTGASSQQPV